jgi:hypothetical protein
MALRIEIEEGLAWCLHSASGVPAAEVHARTALRLAESLGEPTLLAGALALVAFLESLRGGGIATAAIDRAVDLGPRPGWSQILGRPDWVQLGAALGRTWVLTIASRCRGLLNAARGNLDASYRALERALELHERLGEPFERARTLLVLGGVQRRDRKKRAARESLGRALGVFDELGATLWAGRARAELARVGGRAPGGGTDADGGAHRRAGRVGPDLSGSGGRAVHQPQDGAVEPLEDLPQARRPFTRRARRAALVRAGRARSGDGPDPSEGPVQH